ncbi:MAG: hypothetical protein JXL80_14635, partial [Planctomycetes bacterium]|nr:hypothetical protein [Planctomycetota bacterium]
AMIKEFYNRRMTTFIIIFWAFGLACTAVAVWCAVSFFDAEAVKDQILYATIFMVMVVWLGQMKVQVWQLMHRNSLKREIKRLELRIAQLTGREKE